MTESILRFDVANKKDIEKFLIGQSGGMREVSERASINMTLASQVYAREQATTSPRQRTRLYWSSIHPEITRTGGFVVNGLLASNVKYAPIIEDGSRPHVILPRNKKALFWVGARHPVKKVNHPGTRAYHVLANAVNKAAANAQLFVNKALKYFKAKP